MRVENTREPSFTNTSDRRDIANNAHVAHLVDGLPAHGTTAAGRSATLIGKSHLKARGQFALGGHKRQLQLAINDCGKCAVDTVDNNVKSRCRWQPPTNPPPIRTEA